MSTHSPMMSNYMDTLLKKVIHAAQEAGDEIMRLYTVTEFETKADGSPVTIADMRSNEILTTHLASTNIPILSEESMGIPLPYPERLWIIDPLDGTKDFIKKNGDFSVMIGLLEHGKPVLGVVYAPAHKALYYAMRGAGAFVERDGIVTPLAVSQRSDQDLRLIRSVNHFSPRMEAVGKKLSATFHPHGSIGIKAGLVSEDIGDFFFSWGNLGEWDVCAPEIILTEAGGTVTDCLGNPLSYGTVTHKIEHGLVFSNGACHTRLLQAIHTTPPVE